MSVMVTSISQNQLEHSVAHTIMFSDCCVMSPKTVCVTGITHLQSAEGNAIQQSITNIMIHCSIMSEINQPNKLTQIFLNWPR